MRIEKNIDINKCKLIKKLNDRIELLQNACEYHSKVIIDDLNRRSSKREIKNTDCFLKIKKLEAAFLSFEIVRIQPEVVLHTGKSYQFYIDQGGRAMLFDSKILSTPQGFGDMSFDASMPKKIYTINRRAFFRYYPKSVPTINVEFVHEKEKYSFPLDSISGGGFSVRIRIDKESPFLVGDTAKEVQINFHGENIEGMSATIRYVSEKEYEEKPFHVYGWQFLDISSDQQDKILQSIFEEQRKAIKLKKDKNN